MITKNMKIDEVIKTSRNTIAVFSGYGMGCIGCLAASGETVEQAAAVHGIDVDEFLAKLNEAAGK